MIVDSPIITSKDGPVATIVLNRPSRMNALNEGLLKGLLSALDSAAADPEVKSVVLTGSGRAFCAGGDMVGFAEDAQEERPPHASQVEDLKFYTGVVKRLRQLPVVTIAAVNGAAAGAGLSLALACDLRICSSNALFRAAFIDAGLSGDFGGTWLLTRLIGESRARQMYLLNDRIHAAQAQEWGLVSRVFDASEFDDACMSVARGVAAKAPLAVAAMKANFTDASTLGFLDALDRETERHISCIQTGDATEAARAFVEKREPHFQGS